MKKNKDDKTTSNAVVSIQNSDKKEIIWETKDGLSLKFS